MPLTGKDMLKLLKKNGWEVRRKKGSHHQLYKDGKRVTVPVHRNQDLGKGLEDKILKGVKVMDKMIFAYPFVFKKDGKGYLIESVDIPGAYTGINSDDVAYGIEMAEEALALVLEDYIESGDSLPKPTPMSEIEGKENEFVTLVKVDMNSFMEGQKLVKKTLSIPVWANERGIKSGMNFSQMLTEKIVEETLY